MGDIFRFTYHHKSITLFLVCNFSYQHILFFIIPVLFFLSPAMSCQLRRRYISSLWKNSAQTHPGGGGGGGGGGGEGG